jgi:hypothetical protein
MDFYSWSDGSLVRRITPWRLINPSRDGQYYVVNTSGEIFTAAGVATGQVPGWDRGSWTWAGDGDYLCGSGPDQDQIQSLRVVDVTGKSQEVALTVTGDLANIFECSLNTNRAVVLEDDGFNVVSLSDGQTLTKVMPQGFSGGVVSSDTMWVAVSDAKGMQVFNLDDGTTAATMPGMGAVDFAPDGSSLLVDYANGVELVRWQTGDVLWQVSAQSSGPVLESDVGTDRLYVEVGTGSQASPRP